MRPLSSFQQFAAVSVPPGFVRLTRLNIYSALYMEWPACRILVDPAKTDPAVAADLRPDLILVSHESMDHFDGPTVLKYLECPGTSLCASWGTVVALAEVLPADDTRWARILPAVPGSSLMFGDICLRVARSEHCEYAMPVWFDITDRKSGFRIADLVDSELTPEMRAEQAGSAPDLLIVPLGIALNASHAQAWEMVELFRPRAIMTGHFSGATGAFERLAEEQYGKDDILVLSWHQSTLCASSEPRFAPCSEVTFAGPRTNAVAHALATNTGRLPSEADLLSLLDRYPDLGTCADFWYAVATAALLHPFSVATFTRLHAMSDSFFEPGQDRLTASYLLAMGAVAGRLPTFVTLDLADWARRLESRNPYLSYWIIEAIGRAACNPFLRDGAANCINGVADRPDLYGCEPIRRKLMWEFHRLVMLGFRWDGVEQRLATAADDPNPDVRLLAYKTLGLMNTVSTSAIAWLLRGFQDSHEDVLEWVLRTVITLHGALDADQISTLRKVEGPRALHHANYHVRAQANILAELCWEPPNA